LLYLQLHLNFDACGELQGHKGLDRLLGRVHDVDETLVGAALELLAAVLIFVDSAEDGDDFLLGGKRDGAGDLGVRALCGLDDLFRRGVDELMVIRLETNADPTVRPPSRMAKSEPCSRATGMISSTSMLVRSPGMTISTLAGRVMLPVTSMVRM